MEKKSEVALIKLDGSIIRKDGTEEKSDWFKFLELYPDDYSEVTYTPEEARKVRSHLQCLSTGSSAVIPLMCGGKAKCPFAANCPFVRIDTVRKAEDSSAPVVTPVGRQCLVELNLLNEWTRLYVQEYEINERNFTEFQMVRELAEIELMLWRLNNNISKPENAQLVQETVVGVDKEGNALTRLEANAFFEVKERYQNRKTKIVKLMVGDRQERYKREAALRQREDDDPSTNAAQLRTKLGLLLTQAQNMEHKLREAEGTVIDVDVKVVTEDNGPKPLTPEDLINGTGD